MKSPVKPFQFIPNLIGRISVAMLLCGTFMSASLCAQAQTNFTGRITEWKGGSPGVLPKQAGLPDATIVVGTNLFYKTGQSGMDEVRGKMFGTTTDLQGRFQMTLPPGTYMVLVWKAGYTPQVDEKIIVPGGYNQSISVDKSMQGLHKQLSYPGRNDPPSR